MKSRGVTLEELDSISNDYENYINNVIKERKIKMLGKRRGRPNKEPIAFDEEKVKDFIQRFFLIQQEIKGLQQSKKDLKEEFKDKVDMKLVSNVIRLVKAQLKINVSDETKTQLEDIIKDKIGMIIE